MRIRFKLLLSTTGATLACSVAALVLFKSWSEAETARVLDTELDTMLIAVRRAWELEHAERRRAYAAIADQPYFRAYLLAGDRAQMQYFAEAAKRTGASGVLIRDRVGHILARDGLDEHQSSAEASFVATSAGPALRFAFDVGS